MPIRFWGPRIDDDIDDELRFHLEMRERELIAAGMTPDAARARAREQFGDVQEVREWLRRHDRRRQRRAERIEHMDTLVQDVRYGARKLRQHPGFSLGVILVLALGIGAATTMFSAVDAALLRPLPFADGDRLVVLPTISIATEFSIGRPKRDPFLADVQAMDGIESAAAYAPGGLNLGAEDRPRRVRIAVVTPSFFSTVGVQPTLGRAMVDTEGLPGGPRVAIVSHSVWRRDLGGDPAMLGGSILLNGVPHEVIGVMPPGFGFPENPELWLPLRLPFQGADMEAFEQFLAPSVIARLAPDATPEAIGARILAQTQSLRPGQPPDWTAEEAVTPLREDLVGQRRTALLVLLGATGLVLLIACANATNLLLSRAAARQPELTLRAALGASRARLLRQLLVESTFLALIAGALGVLLAYASLDALGALLPSALTGVAEPQVDARVLGFSVMLAALTGVVFGLAPAWRAARSDAAETLKVAGAGGATARGAARIRRVLVVAELALALVLAVGTGLMLRTLQSLVATELGLEPDRVGTAELSLPGTIYDTPERRLRFQHDVLATLQSMPGIDAAALSSRLPLRLGTGSGMIGYGISADARDATQPPPRVMAEGTYVSLEYFRSLGIPLLRGRPARTRRDSAAVGEVVISERTARELWPDGDAIGERIRMPRQEIRIVVGVVREVRSARVEEQPEPQIYLPIGEAPRSHMALVARGTLPASVLATRIQDAVRAVDPLQPVYNVRTMEDVVATAVAPRRTSALLVTTFGIVAIVLAAVGVYGVLAYGVSQRRREIGIRMALGAQRVDVVRLVVSEGARLAVIGVSLGLAGAWAMRRVAESLLYGVTPSDPVTFAVAPLTLLGVALVAALIPARAATRVQAAEAMRA